MLKNPNLTVPILTKSDNFRCFYCTWITIWRNIESLVWKSNLYFVSPGCFWRNWTVLHFQLELHDRNYWLRPAWLLDCFHQLPLKCLLVKTAHKVYLNKHLLSHIFVCFLRILNLNSGPFLCSTSMNGSTNLASHAEPLSFLN